MILVNLLFVLIKHGSSTAIQAILSECQLNPAIMIVYFYFDRTDSGKHSIEKVVRSLIIQLLGQCLKSPNLLQNLHASLHAGRHQPAMEILRATLYEITKFVQHFYVCIDALDECAEREDALGFIKEITTWQLDQLHLLVTSRREYDIEKVIEPLLSQKIGIRDVNADDIRAYVQERTSEPMFKKDFDTIRTSRDVHQK